MICFSKINISSSINEWNELTKKVNRDSFCISLSPHFGIILSELFKMKIEYYVISKSNRNIGLLVGLKKRNKFYSLPVLSNGGIFLFQNNNCEINHIYNLFFSKQNFDFEVKSYHKFSEYVYTKKIIVKKKLPETYDILLNSFKSKLRSQIKKGYKNGLNIEINSKNAIIDFYDLYSKNLHRLGTPVNGISYFLKFKEIYPPQSISFFTVYKDNLVIGSSICFSFQEYFEVMWASTDTRFNKLNPNMVLYNEMMKYSISKKMKIFSFGRSDINSGSLKFKQQWGDTSSVPIFFNYAKPTKNIRSFKFLSKIWKLLPYKLSLFFGPILRKFIIN